MLPSGLPIDYDLEALRKFFLLNLMILIGNFFLILFGAIEFILEDHFFDTINLDTLDYKATSVSSGEEAVDN